KATASPTGSSARRGMHTSRAQRRRTAAPPGAPLRAGTARQVRTASTRAHVRLRRSTRSPTCPSPSPPALSPSASLASAPRVRAPLRFDGVDGRFDLPLGRGSARRVHPAFPCFRAVPRRRGVRGVFRRVQLRAFLRVGGALLPPFVLLEPLPGVPFEHAHAF